MKRFGFSLIEILVAVAIFAVIATGVYSALIYVFKITYLSRVRVLETQIANEQIEIIRNLPYESVGTINGAPSGLLSASATTIRNGIIFQIDTTVRNIDDLFDGTIGGSPNDTSPADYKLVEARVLCLTCSVGQINPVLLSTRVSPKALESASQNGALFIKVFDAAGIPISGATVQITNNKVTPSINITDTTNSTGDLQIIDTPTSTEGYNITAAKSGYTTDYTVAASEQNPNPLKPPATVASQTVTNVSFTIDRVSSINLSTINYQCGSIPTVGFNVNGSKIIGANPNIYKYNQLITTNSGGTYQLNNLEWDTYFFNLNNNSYDIAGAIPTLPVTLNPGTAQDLLIILQPHTANSLLVTVKDNGAKLPLSNAAVTITKGAGSFTFTTGYGYTRQTDWSGGSGQEAFLDATKYFSQDGGVETNSSAGDLYLKQIGNKYYWNGQLISSTIDFGSPSNFTNLVWEPLAQPPQAGSNSVKFQIAASASSSPTSWTFLGPDGAANTYYTTANTNINAIHNGARYLRYKLFLSTANQSFSPQISEVAISFTSGCTPPGQAFFSGLSAGAYDMTVELAGYQTMAAVVDVSGRSNVEILMSQ